MKRALVIIVLSIVCVALAITVYTKNNRIDELEEQLLSLQEEYDSMVNEYEFIVEVCDNLLDMPLTDEEQQVFEENMQQLETIKFEPSVAKEFLRKLNDLCRQGHIPNIQIVFCERTSWSQPYESNGLMQTWDRSGLHIRTADQCNYYITFNAGLDGGGIYDIWRNDGNGKGEFVYAVVY